ncbi:MAG TPA: FemAB family XrtA/PEP-CTERM system-associated protein [Bryobacteraceae bacterium]|nr:FemAB family XrtA/PEP-CTERM system-associated protein [Bryobacteraceae bacterium]
MSPTMTAFGMGRDSAEPQPLPATEIRALQPGDEDEWDRFVLSSPHGTLFHLCGWKTLVEKTLRHKSFLLTARRGKRITGVFPISLVRNPLFGDCLVSLPLAVYGGICASDQDAYSGLLEAGCELANRLGVKYLEMRNHTEPFRTTLPGRDLYVTFTQDLTSGPDKLMAGLPRDTRYAVRKSLKAGLTWTEDLQLGEFYELYAQNVHRLGTPVFSRQLFSVARSIFPRQCRLFGVRKGTKAIAGVMTFYFRDEVIPYYSGALQEYFADSPNNFMYWSLLAQSCAEGFRSFDFGRSKRGTGSWKFKSAWSMNMTDLPYRYHLVRVKEVPHMSPVDAKFKGPVSLWKNLPFPLTKMIGPRLIRWIPSI